MAHLPAGLYIPLYDDPNEGFEAPVNINAGSLAAAGFYPQNATSGDYAAGIYRDASGNLVLKDALAGVKTLSQLAAGGGGGSVTFAAPVSVGDSNSEGFASTAARSDHVHALPQVGTAGSYGSASTIPAITTDAYGRVTFAAAMPVSITAASVSNFNTAVKSVLTSSVSAGSGLSATIDVQVGTVSLANTGVTAVIAGTGLSASGSTGTVTLTNTGVTSVNGSTGAVTGLVTTSDSRLTDARTPTAHASSHGLGGSDALTLAQSQVTGLTVDLAAKASAGTYIYAGDGLTGGGNLYANRTISMPTMGTAGTYGSASSVSVVTVDDYGRVASASTTAISVTSANVTNFTSAVKTVLGSSVAAGAGLSSSVDAETGVVTLSNSGVTSVNGGTGAVTGLVTTSDSRLTDARTPTAHAASHAANGTDALTLAQSQVTNLTTDLAAKAADSAVVHLTGAETVAGVKTFSSSPIVPTPSASTEAANKSYVDTLAAAISGNYGAPVQDLAALRALALAVRVDKQVRLVEDKGAIYRWDSAGTGTDDGDGTITPTDTTGRWFKVSAATQSHNGLTGLQGGAASDYQHLTTAQLGTLTGATSANTASALVQRDASGNFSAGTVTAALTGNASTATKLSASKTFALTGDVTGSTSSDLTSGPSIAATLASVGTAGTYGSATQVPVITTDAKGRVTGVTNTSIAIAQGAVTNLTSDLSSRPTGSGTAGHVAYWSGTSTLTSESALQWDATNNRLGVGTSPSVALDILGLGGTTARVMSGSNSAPAYPALQIYHYTGGFGGHPVMQMYAARGTVAATSAIASNDYLGALIWYGATTTPSFAEGARINAIASAAPSASAVTSVLTFSTSDGSSTSASERVRIDGNGRVGIGTTAPTSSSTYLRTIGDVQMDIGAGITGGVYWDTGTSGFKYAGNNFATLIHNGSGALSFQTAPLNASGAGAVATLTTRFSIGNTGTVSIPHTGTLNVGSGSWTTNGNDVFINTNGASAIYLRPSGAGSSDWQYEVSSGNYHRWLGASAAELARVTSSGVQLRRVNAVADGGAVYFSRASDNSNVMNIALQGGTASPSLSVRNDGGTTLLSITRDGSALVTSTTTVTLGGTVNTPGVGGDSTNTVLGATAHDSRTTATQNVAIGYAALTAVTTNTGNVAVGYNSGAAFTGYGSTFVGALAGNAANAGGYNICIGYNTGTNLTTGSSNVIIGSNNGSLINGTNYNVVIGGLSTGTPHLFINGNGYGYIPGRLNLGSTDTAAVALHTRATNENIRMEGTDPWATFYQSGSRKGWFGYGSGAATTTFAVTNEIGSVLLNASSGNFVQVNRTFAPASHNSFALGTSGAAWSDVWNSRGAFNGSDARIKNNIQDSDRGLQFIEALRPVKYKLNVGRVEFVTREDGTEERVEIAGTRPHYGFIAQEVKAVIDASPEGDFAGYAYAPETDSHWLTYEEFISPLVKAVQELSAQNKELKARLTALEAKLTV